MLVEHSCPSCGGPAVEQAGELCCPLCGSGPAAGSASTPEGWNPVEIPATLKVDLPAGVAPDELDRALAWFGGLVEGYGGVPAVDEREPGAAVEMSLPLSEEQRRILADACGRSGKAPSALVETAWSLYKNRER